MTKFKALLTAAAVLAVSAAASAEELAARVDRPIESVTNVVKRVEARDDYAAYSAIHYNRAARSYEVRYTAKDGSPKLLIIDAVTGEERG
jgi:uncharacterized iron-regulated membrane protein